METELNGSELNDSELNKSKLRLIIRKPQSGKTYICIKDIETTPTDLHIVMTMNTIKSNKQFLGRVIEKMGGENIIIYNSDLLGASSHSSR